MLPFPSEPSILPVPALVFAFFAFEEGADVVLLLCFMNFTGLFRGATLVDNVGHLDSVDGTNRIIVVFCRLSIDDVF